MVCAFFFSSRLVLFWGVFDVFWGVRWVSLGFHWFFWWLVWIVHLGEHQVGLRLFWALNHVFSSDPVRFWGVFDVFWGFRCVLLRS